MLPSRRGGSYEAPPSEWSSPINAFEAAYAHEQKVSGLINDLISLAGREQDNATYNLLQWFVCEQVEEEALVDDVVKKLKLTADAPAALFILDRELSQRIFTPHPTTQGAGA